jgi:hypothetical protein
MGLRPFGHLENISLAHYIYDIIIKPGEQRLDKYIGGLGNKYVPKKTG